MMAQPVLSFDRSIIVTPHVTYSLPQHSLARGRLALVHGDARCRVADFMRLVAGRAWLAPVEFPGSAGTIVPRTFSIDRATVPFKVNGVSVYEPEAARTVGLIESDPDRIIIGRTPLEDYLHARGVVDKAVDELGGAFILNAVGLGSRMFTPSQDLSGGEKQRLTVATATVSQDLRVLVVDLTASSLDEAFSAQLFGWLKGLLRGGRAVVAAGLSLTQARTISGNLEDWSLRHETGGTISMTVGPALADSDTAGVTNCTRNATVRPTVILQVTDFSRLSLTRPISFTVMEGEVIRLTGPNGCGKSTLARAIVSGVPWWKRIGPLRLSGRIDLSRGVRPLLSSQFPEGDLGARSVLDEIANVAMLRSYGFGDDELNMRPQDLPPSFQKLLSVATAFHGSRGLVVLDEPTIGLSAEHRLAFDKLLCAFANKAIIIATHDKSLARVGREVPMKLTTATALSSEEEAGQ